LSPPPMPSREPDRLAFGLVPPPSFLGHERINALLRWIGEQAGVQLVRRHVSSYDELVTALRKGELDVAWLPPIPFARLQEERIVRPLVCAERGGEAAFVAVLFTRAGSTVFTEKDLHGRHVGWVDPLSTTGYVVPRMRIASAYPGVTFGRETFFGSHAAVVRAVLDGVVDAGASYGGFSPEGDLIRGAFLDVGAVSEDVRVMRVFDAIPPDVIAVHTRIGPELEEGLARAFEATANEPTMLDSVRAIFGALYFSKRMLVGYEALQREVDRGVDSGVIPAAAGFLSTRPPPEH
jgi:phosphate/phosphite/phosphonate ABC transporter binding protein